MNNTDSAIIEPEIEETDDSQPFNPISRADFLKTKDDVFDPVRDIKWVYNALGVEGLQPGDAPSAGAWRLLYEASQDILVLKGFYAGSFSKLLATSVQTEQELSRAEDGREEFTLIDRLLREPDDLAPILSDTEKRARELALSRTYPESGLREQKPSKRVVGCV